MPKPRVGDTRNSENGTVEQFNGAEWVRVPAFDREPSESDRPEVVREEERLP